MLQKRCSTKGGARMLIVPQVGKATQAFGSSNSYPSLQNTLSQNMTLMPGRNRPKSSPCHRSPLHGGYTTLSTSSCNCCSFCSGYSCSDSEPNLSTKGERRASKNEAHELDVRRHGMTALQKPAWGERCCLQTEPD